MKTEDIARLCHEFNRAYCRTLGDGSQLPWEEAPDWQRQSAINGVVFQLANPWSGPSASHDNWMREKLGQGWVYGVKKDPEAKTHPCLVSWDELPDEQRLKDVIFAGTVRALAYV